MKLTSWLKCLPLLLLMTSFIPTKEVEASVVTARTTNPYQAYGKSYISQGDKQLRSRTRSRIRFRLPPRGAPGGTIIGGVRGWSGECGSTPVALLPKETNLGLTTAAKPTVFMYVPPNSPTSGEFVLIDESKNRLYQTTISLSNTPGVISVPIPAQVASSLQADKNYQWWFLMECSADGRFGQIAYSQGWIVRSNPSATLSDRLKTAKPDERAAIYAEAGYWYDTLATLAELRRLNPNDANLTREWSDLLESVGLSSIADKPLVSAIQK